MQTFSEIWCDVQRIEGWLTEGQGLMLYDAAANIRAEETIVEIGSHHGRSTVILGAAKPTGTRLLAVDPYGDPRWGGGEDALEIFRSNLLKRGLCDVELARTLGADAGREWSGGRVGVLFVDGAHDFASVDADLRAWLPHVSPTGVVLIHDMYSSPGVTRAAFAHMFGSDEFVDERSSRSLVAFRRGEQSLQARVASCARMFRKLPWLGRNLTIKMAFRLGWRSILPLLGHRGSMMPY